MDDLLLSMSPIFTSSFSSTFFLKYTYQKSFVNMQVMNSEEKSLIIFTIINSPKVLLLLLLWLINNNNNNNTVKHNTLLNFLTFFQLKMTNKSLNIQQLMMK